MLEPRRKITALYACRWFREYKEKEKVKGFYFADEEGNNWNVKVSKKQKLAWEKASCVGYMIEWDKDLRAFYRKDL